MRQRTAIFPGSFDPFTLGHLDVLKSSLGLFDKIIIAVGYNHLKKGFLSPQARVRLIQDSIRELSNRHPGTILEVKSYTGMTIDFCRENKASFLIRGLRTTADFENETIIAQANRLLHPEIQTLLIPPSAEHSFISSTVVRDVYLNQGDVRKLLAEGIHIENYLTDEQNH